MITWLTRSSHPALSDYTNHFSQYLLDSLKTCSAHRHRSQNRVASFYQNQSKRLNDEGTVSGIQLQERKRTGQQDDTLIRHVAKMGCPKHINIYCPNSLKKQSKKDFTVPLYSVTGILGWHSWLPGKQKGRKGQCWLQARNRTSAGLPNHPQGD